MYYWLNYDDSSVYRTEDWFRHFRDGKPSDTSSKTGLKRETNGNIRAKNKNILNRVKKDIDECDDIFFADKYSEKYLIWNYF